MAWTIKITEEARKDYKKIEGSIRAQVLAGILKVSKRHFQVRMDMGSRWEIKMETI